MYSNMGKILYNYPEISREDKGYILDIAESKSLGVKGRKIAREIVLEKDLGQDLTENDIRKNIDKKDKIKYMLSRLFIDDIEDLYLDRFINKVKNGTSLVEFFRIHRKYPLITYKQLIISL